MKHKDKTTQGRSNRRRGIALEHSVRDDLLEAGYYVVRPAGSKGPADLVAMHKGRILFVQVKVSGYMPPGERLELERAAHRAGAIALLADRIRLPEDKRRTRIRYRNPEGSVDWGKP